MALEPRRWPPPGSPTSRVPTSRVPTSLVAAGDFGLRMLWGQWAFVVLLRAVSTVLLVTVRDGPWPGPGQLAVLGAWGAALALLTAGWRGVRRLL